MIQPVCNRLTIAGLFCLLLASCAGSKKSRSVTLEEIKVGSKTSEYRGTEPKVWDITHTKIALSFNMKEKTADGKAWLTMHPYFYATDTLELDAKSMQIDSVLLGRQMLTYRYADEKLHIKLPRKYASRDSIQLVVKYKAMPYAQPVGGSKAISEDRGLYFINTDYSIPGKPAQIWTQGETQSNSHWMPTHDNPGERFTVELVLTVPDSFKTLSNGALKSQDGLGAGLRTDRWVMDKPIQAYAVMFAIGKFSVIKDEWKGKEVSYYVEKEYEPYARQMFKNTPAMMSYYSGVTGVSYPWNKYSQVVVRDYVSGAMENTSASLFGEFMNQNARELADEDHEDVVAHELFHQWFGDYVTAESWSNITLNESFANYGEVLWKRYKYGDEKADEYALQQMWSYVFGQSKANDPALVRFHYNSREDVFDRISYQKGGAVLGYLHGLVGDSAFYKSMGRYLQRNAYQSAEATQWRLAVEEVTGQDWNWFFNQWYYRGGHPVLDFVYDYDDVAKQLNVTVTQKQQDLYRLPMKTWLVYGDVKTEIDWNVANRNEHFSYPYKEGVKPVVLADANHWVVGEMNYNLSPGNWLQVYRLSNDNIVNKYFAILSARRKIEDTCSVIIINEALKDRNSGVRQTAVESLAQLKGNQWKEKWKKTVIQMAKNDEDNKVRTSAIGLLERWKVTEAKGLVYDAIYDSSYFVSGAALSAYSAFSGTNKDTVYNLAKQLLGTKPKSNLRSTIWDIIGQKGNADDAHLFVTEAWQFSGRNKISFASSMSLYLQHVHSKPSFDTVLNTFVAVTLSENISSYRSAIASYIFEAATICKKIADNSKSKAEREEMQWKLDQLKAAIDKVIAAEANQDNMKQYKNFRKILFGKN
jgi:aminopeptidase N